MPNNPILIFPRASNAPYTLRAPKIPKPKLKTPEEQAQRLGRRWTELEGIWQDMQLSSSPSGSVSEMILVLEINGTLENFVAATRSTSGIQFLSEYFDFQTDLVGNYTIADEDDPAFPTSTRIFLTMTNQDSMDEIIRLWNVYQSKAKFPRGLTPYKQLFGLLNDVRFYGVQDRLRDTGLERHLSELAQMGVDKIKVEIELVFRSEKSLPRKAAIEAPNDGANSIIYDKITSIIHNAGGRVIEGSKTYLPDIHYHALIAEIPIELFEDIGDNTDVELLRANQIMYFRPLPQVLYKEDEDEVEEVTDNSEELLDNTDHLATYANQEVATEPIAALLDGLPLQNHTKLAGKLIIDDPDDLEANYEAAHRFHGTAMASLIINGDLSDTFNQPIKSLLYSRPILIAKEGIFGAVHEELYEDRLPLDLLHKAVRRMLVGDLDSDGPIAPKVKIINFSIGDSYRPFLNNISTWARLIDWMSYKYNILFIISAGNIGDNIIIDIPNAAFNTTPQEEIMISTLKTIANDNINRKILTPSESVNSITVGACESDRSAGNTQPNQYSLINNPSIISPVSRVGFGYKGSVKPDILMPGGIKCFKKQMMQSDTSKTALQIDSRKHSFFAPGVKVAVPGNAGSLNTVSHTWGTSVSTALTTRLAIQIHEALEALNQSNAVNDQIPEKFFTPLIKALIVHSADWKDGHNIMADIIKDHKGVVAHTIKKHITPYLGYGTLDSQKVLYSTNERVTLLGWGELHKDKAHTFAFPLPDSLERQAVEKRLTITLAWISPINWQTHKYRQSRLYFDNISADSEYGGETIDRNLSLERHGLDWNTSRRGTVQHDILIGHNADVYIDGDEIVIKVNCRQDAGGLGNKPIRYGIAVTLDVDPQAGIEIYNEIQQKLAIRPQIRPRT